MVLLINAFYGRLTNTRFGEDDASRYLAFRKFSELGDGERTLTNFREVDLNDRSPNDFAVAARSTNDWLEKAGLYFVAGSYWTLAEMKSMVGASVEAEEYVLTVTCIFAITAIWMALTPKSMLI